MFNYEKIIKQLELMNNGERLRFCELLCEKNDMLAFAISNNIEVTMMDKSFLKMKRKYKSLQERYSESEKSYFKIFNVRLCIL